MEFPFDLNYILPHDITILNGDYRVLNPGQTTRILAADKLTTIIDAMGDASFRAQGLAGAVTTARKFRMSDHRLYIIKKPSDHHSAGSIVGILKVGTKHLYVYDSSGRVHERTPMCVLDFYVHESKQRLGYGKQLFDTMLEYEKCAPYELAIDRPSNKCLAFLHKHYHLSAPIHQVNNFVVYHAFFSQPPVSLNRKTSFTEQNGSRRSEPLRTSASELDIFGNRRQATLVGALSARNERQYVPSYTTSYGQHYNRTGFSRERSDGVVQSVAYIPRSYSQVFNENNPFSNSQWYSTTNQQSSSINNSNRRYVETVPNNMSRVESSTSVYTFPSLIKPTSNWRQQQSTIDSSSSSWNLFGVHRLLN